MASLLDAVRNFCLTQGLDKNYRIGFSGGLDSHVLLHLLAAVRSTLPLQLSAVYVNHGLSPNANQWSDHCATVCRDLQIEFTCHHVKIDLSLQKSPEEIAREARYHVFKNLVTAKDILLTAHHQDDQAETVLLQMLRGAGPKGLAAMPRIKPFAQGWHARPLLDFTRADLKKYADENKLQWIEDESNTDIHYTRNFLRHEILPLLQKRWPNVTDNLARVADNCAAAQEIIDDALQEDLIKIAGSQANTISIKKLVTFNESKQKMLLRAWLQQLNFPIPSAVKLQQIQTDMLHAREDKMPHIKWGSVEMRRYRDDLFIMKIIPSHDLKKRYTWDLSQALLLENIGTLRANFKNQKNKNVSVRFRQGGEVIKLPGRKCHHTLKKLFQEKSVPEWLRERVPLIFVEEELAVVTGYFVAEGFLDLDVDLSRV